MAANYMAFMADGIWICWRCPYLDLWLSVATRVYADLLFYVNFKTW